MAPEELTLLEAGTQTHTWEVSVSSTGMVAGRVSPAVKATTVALVAVALAVVLAALFAFAKPAQTQEQTIIIEPTQIGFGAVEVSANAQTRTVTISNNGTIDLVIGGVDILGTNADAFGLATTISPEGLIVGAGDVATFDVSFDPLTEGAQSATLTLTDLLGNILPGAPSVDLSGTGVTVLPPADADCSIRGTDSDEVLTGTPGNDVICALGGNDTVDGMAGDDIIKGGNGGDTLVGGSGKDRLLGQSGKDVLNARDNAKGDFLKGGPGKDRFVKDRGDTVRQ